MREESSGIVYFREEQRFRQVWMWALILLPSLILLYAGFEQFVGNKRFDGDSLSDPALMLVIILIGIGLPVFFFFLRLVTEVRPEGVFIRFFPFHLRGKLFLFSDITSYEAIEYRPLLDYGGYGIRFGMKATAYNVSGNRGVFFELSSRRPVMIGSQRPDEMVMAIDAARSGRASALHPDTEKA